jgi:hypothetical protein
VILLFDLEMRPLGGRQQLFRGMARLNPMGNMNNAHEQTLLDRLREDYDRAFNGWKLKVKRLQSLRSESPQDVAAVEAARRQTDEAAGDYREKRNLLLEYMIASGAVRAARRESRDAGAAAVAPFAASDRSGQVRKLARQIWEDNGRPSGTADADWRQAEVILQTRK